MIEAMIREVDLTATSQNKIDSIYFGGGTPSLLNAKDLKKLLCAVYKKYNVSADAEITLEANPDDISETKLSEWKSVGINRFSIGIQSFNNEDLLWMNRAHNVAQAMLCIKQVKDAGFQNFSVDLIYGTPTLSDDGWKKNVQTVIDLNVPHLSCYALTVEDKTALHKMISLKKKQDVDPEKQAHQFLLLLDWLTVAGYEHYEISNFAKPGFRSKHNSSYWQGKSYIGIGPSAHSFNGEVRRWNVSNNALYIQSLKKNIIPYQAETLSEIQKLNEYIMTSLRTTEGIDIDLINKNFGKELRGKLEAAAMKYSKNEKVQITDQRIMLTGEGKLFADGIAADLFFSEQKKSVL